VVDFKNTIIMMTSNVGSAFLNENPSEGAVKPEIRESVMGSIRSTFPPEFLNRIDVSVLFTWWEIELMRCRISYCIGV
jgi:ATP-dependent Clp protease ATP-binding subunit ClpB